MSEGVFQYLEACFGCEQGLANCDFRKQKPKISRWYFMQNVGGVNLPFLFVVRACLTGRGLGHYVLDFVFIFPATTFTKVVSVYIAVSCHQNAANPI